MIKRLEVVLPGPLADEDAEADAVEEDPESEEVTDDEECLALSQMIPLYMCL